MNKRGEKRISLKNDNRGSTIVVVIVAFSFVLILAAALMFASYTNYRMKITDRGSKQNMYDAEAVLNEIRIGVQQVASDAIADAYTDVLVDYNAAVDTENAFKIYFVRSLSSWKVKVDNSMVNFIVPGESRCDLSIIRSFVSEPEGVTLSGGQVVIPDDAESPIEIRSLTVDYVKNGYRTSISTDIHIKMPEFTYTLSELILSSVPDYTVIANEKLTQSTGGSLVVDGNAYAGEIDVTGVGNTMNIGVADNFVCHGTLTASSGASFVCGPNSSLWAQDIVIGDRLGGEVGASVVLTGDTYVSDDLELRGNKASASVSGRYFGFGNSTADPSASSSIIINGKSTQLTFSSIKTLMLAGTCFIDGRQNDSESTSYVLMGESISVKSNQLAYLIPISCLKNISANPLIIATADVPGTESLKGYVDKETVLWDGKTLGSYIDDVQIVYYSLGNGQTLVYFYMQFNTAAKANAYFADYFTNNKHEIEQYLPLYSEGINLLSTVHRNIAGNAITFNEGKVGLINASLMVSQSTCQRLDTMYTNLCSTLNSSITGEGTVYQYIVNDEEIGKLPGDRTYFTNTAGVRTAVICKGDVNVDSEMPTTVKVIIATGNVQIDRADFTGLVIAGGNVILNNDLKADREAVTEAFRATAMIDGANLSLIDFLELGSESIRLPNVAIGAINWDLERIVSFENWTKN